VIFQHPPCDQSDRGVVVTDKGAHVLLFVPASGRRHIRSEMLCPGMTAPEHFCTPSGPRLAWQR
jgi:hypothetical protein